MSKLILGFVGEIASGKGTVAKHIADKHNAGYHRFSTPIRKVLDTLHIEQTRENLQQMSSALRSQIDEAIFAKAITEDVKADEHEVIVVDGMRRPADIVHLKELPNFHMINVSVEERTRYERLTQRTENADDQSKTFEEFQAQAQEEPEQKIRELAGQADFTIDNNGTMEQMQKQADDLVAKLKA